MENNRKNYLDYLRVIATIGVLIVHVVASPIYEYNMKSLAWYFVSFLDALPRFSVPVFCCISGALFLDENKEIGIKKLYTKTIFRIITAFAFWSVLYAVYYQIKGGWNTFDFVSRVINGNFHLWFLYMIAGFYICVPVLRRIVTSKSTIKYYLLVSFVFNFVLLSISYIPIPIFEHIQTIINEKLKLYMFLGYIPYFVLGYYLDNNDFDKKTIKRIYAIGLFGFVLTFVSTVLASFYTGKPFRAFIGDLALGVFFETIGFYVLIKRTISKRNSDRTNRIMASISKLCFGVYLVHPLIIELLRRSRLTVFSFRPYIGFIVIFTITTVLSFIVSYVLNKIPFINKYIV